MTDIIIQFVTLGISIASIIVAITVFVVTYYKMKKSEQIKMVHDIQESYFKAFDKFRESHQRFIESQTGNNNRENASIDFIGLCNILEWYAFLRAQKQIDCKFDDMFDNYFRGARGMHLKHYQNISLDGHRYFGIKWQNLEQERS
jgi:hypothetical protein